VANFTLKRVDLFPSGTNVDARKRALFGNVDPAQGVAPPGAAEQTVASDGIQIAFAGLADETEYVFSGQVGGVWKHTSGRTTAQQPSPSVELTQERTNVAAASVGALATAPGAAAVVADTGALPAGDYTIDVELDAAAVLAAGKALIVEHRNAANAATVKPLGGCGAGQSRTLTIRRLTLAANERVRVIVGAVAFGAGETATAAIQAYPAS
jgi:hypothetical protein